MADGSQSRFVSKGFEGVTLIPGERRGPSLLKGRSARLAVRDTRDGSVEHVLTKSVLIKAVAQSADISRQEASRALDGVLQGIAEALKNGREVRLGKFGTFAIESRVQPGNTPTRAGVKMPAQPTFKAGKALKDAVN